MSLALLLPRIASGSFSTELWNRLVGLAGSDLPLDGGASLRFSLATPPAANSWLTALNLSGGGTAHLFVRDFPFRKLFNVGLDTADVAALPQGLRQALLDGMLGAILAALPASVRDAASVAAQGLPAALPDLAASHTQWFDVTLTGADGTPIQFSLGCDRAAILRLLGDVLARRAPVAGPLADRLSLSAYPTLGRVVLGMHEFEMLEAGAMVVLPHRPPDQLSVRVDTVHYQFAQGQNGWTCLGGHPALNDRISGARMDDTDGNPADAGTAPGPVSVGDLKIAVDFDIAHMLVPVGDLARWQPGAVVGLDLPATADNIEVTIRANGEVVGQGDLVRIDDRLAVRISRLLLRR